MEKLIDFEFINNLTTGVFFYRFKAPDKLYLINGNKSAERITGLKISELIGKEFNEIWTKAKENGITDSYLKVMSTGKPFISDQEFYSDNHLRGIFKINAFKLEDDLLCVSFDEVSKIVHTNNLLRLTEYKYNLLLDNVFDAILLLKERKIEYCNYKFCEITGYNYEELLDPEFEFTSLLIGSNKLIFDEFYMFTKKGLIKKDNFNLQILNKNGELVIVNVSAKIFDQSDEFLIFCVMRDVTEQIKIMETLKESELKYRTVVDNSHEGIAVIQNDKFVFVNQTFINLTEKGAKHFIGQNIYNFIYPDDYEIIRKAIQKKIIGQDSDQKVRFRYIDDSDKIIWVEASSVVIHWENKPALLVFFTNINEQIEIKEQLTLNQAILKSALEQSNIGIIIMLPQNEVPLFISKHAKELLGIDEIDFINPDEPVYPNKWRVIKDDGTILPVTELPLTKAIVHSITTPLFDYRIQRKDGKLLYISGTAAPVFNDSNKLIAGILIFQDITQLREYQEEFRQAKEKLSMFIQNAQDMIYFVTPELQITMLNNAHCGITGYTLEEFENEPNLFLNLIHPDDLDKIKLFFKNNPNGTIYYSFEFRIASKNGSWKWIQARMIGMYDKYNKFIGYNSISRDITELKDAMNEIKNMNIQLEERVKERTIQLEKMLNNLNNEIKVRQATENQLILAQQDLTNALQKEKELNELKSRFISMISHEYRTPLTVIMTSTYLLEQLFHNRNEENFLRHLEKIRASVKTMTKLLEDVLTLGKSESGKLILNPTSFDLIMVCNEIIDEMKLIDNKQHYFNFISKTSSCHIINDEKLIRQIITNLLSNAIKYSPINSEIKFELDVSKNSVNISITDYGIGIRPEDQKYLFEPFHRGKNVGTVSGTGLGLAIVKRCLELMNGKISIKSSISGTTFLIEFPQNILKNKN